MLAEANPEITRIMLFGSLARDEAGPGSDADLLIILRASDRPFLERSVHYQPVGVGIGVDVFAYTEHELATLVADGNMFVQRALREGLSVLET
ncbi:MAG: nucleotidyltransferase domain-containing protein [Dehalococcoidia bacterium]